MKYQIINDTDNSFTIKDENGSEITLCMSDCVIGNEDGAVIEKDGKFFVLDGEKKEIEEMSANEVLMQMKKEWQEENA